MAARLQQLRSKAVQASGFVCKHGGAYYKELLEKNKHHIVEPSNIEKCQELSKQLFYTRLARSASLWIIFVWLLCWAWRLMSTGVVFSSSLCDFICLAPEHFEQGRSRFLFSFSKEKQHRYCLFRHLMSIKSQGLSIKYIQAADSYITFVCRQILP